MARGLTAEEFFEGKTLEEVNASPAARRGSNRGLTAEEVFAAEAKQVTTPSNKQLTAAEKKAAKDAAVAEAKAAAEAAEAEAAAKAEAEKE